MVETPKADARDRDQPEPSWKVILYNDDVQSFDEVEMQLQKATGCSLEAACEITMTAHTKGRAVAYLGDRTDCERVAGVLRQISLQVDLDNY